MTLGWMWAAWRRTNGLLWQPPRLKRIAKLGVIVAIAFSMWLPSVPEARILLSGQSLQFVDSYLAKLVRLIDAEAESPISLQTFYRDFGAVAAPLLIGIGLLAIYLSSVFHYVLLDAATLRLVAINRSYRQCRVKAFGLFAARTMIAVAHFLIALAVLRYSAGRADSISAAQLIIFGLPTALCHRLLLEFTLPFHRLTGRGFFASLWQSLLLLLRRPLRVFLYLIIRALLSVIILIGSLILTSPLILLTIGGAGYVLWSGLLQGMPQIVAGDYVAGAPGVLLGSVGFMAVMFLGTWLIFCVAAPGVLFLRSLSLEFMSDLSLLSNSDKPEPQRNSKKTMNPE